MEGFCQQVFLQDLRVNNMNSIDLLINDYFSLSKTPVLVKFMSVVTSFFDASFHFILIVVGVSLIIYLVRGLKYAILFFTSLFLGAVIVFFLKNIFNIARPLDGLVYVLGQSFPSYHATSATIFFIMLMYVFDSYLNSFTKTLFNIFCISCAILVSFSRIYLGVHWFSDVFAGVLLGIVVSTLFIFIFKHVIKVHSRASMLK